MNIGFIGLGIMGTPMALHLVSAGHQLHVHGARSRRDSASGCTKRI
jgi:2-hydroxy-3-oxopropionate reductase